MIISRYDSTTLFYLWTLRTEQTLVFQIFSDKPGNDEEPFTARSRASRDLYIFGSKRPRSRGTRGRLQKRAGRWWGPDSSPRIGKNIECRPSGGLCEPFEPFSIGSIGPPSCLFLTMFLTWSTDKSRRIPAWKSAPLPGPRCLVTKKASTGS